MLLILVYVLSLVSYAFSGRNNILATPGETSNGVNVQFNVVGIDPTKTQLTLRAFVIPTGTFLSPDEAEFAKTLEVTSRAQTAGEVTRVIKAGTPVGGANEFTILVDGNPSTYPFDQYVYGIPKDWDEITDDGDGDITISSTEPAPLLEVTEMVGGQRVPVSVGILSATGIQGWTEDWTFQYKADALYMELVVKRGGGVIAFVCVVLALMIVVGVLAAIVAYVVAAKRRPIEATMSGWFAALLFALVPLRMNLPGAPPIGVWMDVAVFYWVEMGLLVAMVFFVGSWLRYRKPPTDA